MNLLRLAYYRLLNRWYRWRLRRLARGMVLAPGELSMPLTDARDLPPVLLSIVPPEGEPWERDPEDWKA